MELARCSKGHVYNPMENATCPVCAAENAQGGMNFGSFGAGMDNIGATAPVGGMDPIGATMPVGGFGGASMNETVPVSNPGFAPNDFASRGGYNTSPVADYSGTAPVAPGGVAGFFPVVGWLVCIEGPDKGSDYRIHNGNNYIGRSPNMDICIMNDRHISHDNAANIGYDDHERIFFFGPAGGRNTVRVNGKMVINSVELSPYDTITLGTSKLMFVPLCGERFDWNGEQK